MTPAVFLDRDGTIIEQVHYLKDPAQVRLLPRSAAAIRLLRESGLRCVVVSNQSGVGRGLMTTEDVAAVVSEMTRQLRSAGADVDASYFCPDVPRVAGGSDTAELVRADRKPGAGMLLRASCELGIAISHSWMVGDMPSDVNAGRNAGVRGSVLVRTGHGVGAPSAGADHVAEDLYAAAEWILDRRQLRGTSRVATSSRSVR